MVICADICQYYTVFAVDILMLLLLFSLRKIGLNVMKSKTVQVFETRSLEVPILYLFFTC